MNIAKTRIKNDSLRNKKDDHSVNIVSKTRIKDDFRTKKKDDFMMMIENDKKNAKTKRLIIEYHCSSFSTKLFSLIRSIKEDLVSEFRNSESRKARVSLIDSKNSLVSEFRNSELSESRFSLIRLASDRLFNLKAFDMKR